MPEPQDLVKRYGTAVDVLAYGDRLEDDWSPGKRVTSVGGLAFFAMFLKEAGLFDWLCEDFPISYTSNNSCSNGKLARPKPASERKPVGRALSCGAIRVGKEPN